MHLLTAVFSGLLFGLGLLLSGMANPNKVIRFLDITGLWDPSLAFVMGGAIVATFPSFMLIKRMSKSVCNMPFDLPTRTTVDYQLVIGSALFGMGWGLGGICPGPGLVTAALGVQKAIVFVVAMIIGMMIHQVAFQKK